MKFLLENEEVIEFNGLVNDIDVMSTPFKEILEWKDLSSINFVLDEQEPVNLGELFFLKVNVKKVGAFTFAFNKDGLDRMELIGKIKPIKDMEETEELDKVSALFEVIHPYSPLFVIFLKNKESEFDVSRIHELEKEIHVFLGEREEPVEVQHVEKKIEEVDNSPFVKRMFKIMGKNKFHLLLILVSTVLFEISIPLGILNVYSENMLYIFLFICAGIGVAMNGYSYIDYFRTKTFKEPLFIFSCISNLLGVAIGAAGFVAFYNISNKSEGTPGLSKLILIGAMISLAIVVMTIIICYLVPKTKRDDKAA